MSFDVPNLEGNLRPKRIVATGGVPHTRAAGTLPLHRPSAYGAKGLQPPENTRTEAC